MSRFYWSAATGLPGRVRPPVAVALGGSLEVLELLAWAGVDAECYQMDLYQANKLQEAIANRQLASSVSTAADLWELPGGYGSVLFPTMEGGERELKIDMVEQAFHILRPQGILIVLSPYEKDQLFPGLLKKIFGKVHATRISGGTMFWCHREGEHPRRRHEMTFRARFDDTRSLTFLSRPGVFSYGRFDDGARALVQAMQINPGDRILDLGCGCGTNGVYAALQAGPTGWVTFADSNLRAIVLAEHNARSNGVTNFDFVASAHTLGLQPASFDVVLANPPYFAGGSIADSFVQTAVHTLRPGGRLYLVTKQADVVGPMIADLIGPAEVVERRGYAILSASLTVRRGQTAHRSAPSSS